MISIVRSIPQSISQSSLKYFANLFNGLFFSLIRGDYTLNPTNCKGYKNTLI